jgi:hypothetical protein
MLALAGVDFGNALCSVIGTPELSCQRTSRCVPWEHCTCLREIGLHEV